MRKYTVPTSMAVEYFLGDHLGSTSVTTDSTGAKISEIKYKPWGEIRSAPVSPPANISPAYKLASYTFTGQFSYLDDPNTGPTEGFGLMFYQSRWYDPYITQFSQPDSIIPDPYNPQDWNRYSYARYNPLKYTDPSGHAAVCPDCGGASLEQTLEAFKKYGKHKDKFNELYATIYFAEESLADALNDGQLSESEVDELQIYEEMIQVTRDRAFNNLSQDELGGLVRAPSSSTLLKRATDRAEVVNGFVISAESPFDNIGDLSPLAAIVVIFKHGGRHLLDRSFPVNLTKAQVEAAITKNIELNVNPASTGFSKGFITIDGVTIEYHVWSFGDGIFSVGTYYPEER